MRKVARCVYTLEQRNPWNGLSLLALLLLFHAGCANTCFVFVSNPPNGTAGILASNTPASCKLAEAKGFVSVVTHINNLCAPCSQSDRPRAVLLRLRGMDIHSSPNLVTNSADWQELFPELEKQPHQVDLLNEAPKTLSAELSKGARVLIPIGTYDLVRFRFAPNQAEANDEFSEKNVCGMVGSNCVIMADGQIEPLVFADDVLQIAIASKSAMDGLLLILPDSENELLIELTPVMQIGTRFGVPARVFSLLPSKTKAKRSYSATKSAALESGPAELF
jgi:hypothetical protein